ncbi:MAG: hypothetical protein K0V04_38145 [Deltaproteobacteria bacterium]|nr:hypothetical protein [Deltaproteobacteria bacterium]
MLLALLDAHPEGPGWARSWLTDTLRASLPGYGEDDREHTLRGWSVGAAWGNETLVQSRPLVRTNDIDPIDDLLRTPASCVVAAFSVQSTGAGALVAPPAVKLSRFRRWLGVRVGQVLPQDLASHLRSSLPGFLSRHQVDRGDGELVFLTFLAQLHAAGGLRKTYSEPALIREALSATARAAEIDPPHNLVVSDGRTFAMLHQAGSLVSFEPPPVDDAAPRFGVTPTGVPNRPTNLLLHTEHPPSDAPQHGGERVAEGVFTIDVRSPRSIER